MTPAKRRDLMEQCRLRAREYDRRDDTVLREQSARSWRELATDAEAKRAPLYLWWPGRRDA